MAVRDRTRLIDLLVYFYNLIVDMAQASINRLRFFVFIRRGNVDLRQYAVGQRVSEISDTGKLYPGTVMEMHEKRENQAYIKFDDGEMDWVNLSKLTEKLPTRVQQTIDGITFQLEEEFDFSFVSKYGRVFKVFDNSFSGAICFGVEKEGKRYFLKFVGAKTTEATCTDIEDVIMTLKISVPKYRDLKHPLLVDQIYSEEVGGGFLAVYDWFDGEGCGYMHPEMQKKFLTLPDEDKLCVYNGVLEFFNHVIECGYIAVDFNNGSTLYNFDNGSFAFCDIDFFAKHSQISGWSGIWGDPSFKSPEECRGYSIVSEVSNVYTLGAIAFYFFAGNDKNSREKWTLSDVLYDVAKKAISEQRSRRQQTVREFIDEWERQTKI